MSVVNNEPIGLSHRSDGVILGDTPYSLFFDVEAPSLLAYDWSVGGGVAAQFTIVAGTQADRRTLHSAREASANGHLRLDEGPVTVMWRCDPSVFAPFFATRAVLQYHLVLSADRQVTARQQDMALLERRRVELQAAVAHEANFHTILEAEWKAADERARQETHRPVQVEMDARMQAIELLASKLAAEQARFDRCCEEQAAIQEERAEAWSRACAHEAKRAGYERELERVRARQRAYALEMEELAQRLPSLVTDGRAVL
ncbi:hypothetical protein AB1Y20_018176 [Prymnesium parvum]|uniref:Uncharacterized protein n=1 Tax=Prymnesium parvum TaxID=97485 RepID=A0AB34JRI9_PRYPA